MLPLIIQIFFICVFVLPFLFPISDIYSCVLTQSPIINKLFLRLQDTIEKEINYQEELLEVLGMMDTLFATMHSKEEPLSGASQPLSIPAEKPITDLKAAA